MAARRPYELLTAFAAVVMITLLYLWVNTLLGATPASSSLFGHGIGVAGFVLMLMTETLYSLRKRSRLARWGRMTTWLQFHIVTGIVGPYMVLLHSAWKFNGLAGVVMWLTAVIVISGFVGRYLYTSIPRSADGIAFEDQEIQRQIASIEQHLAQLNVGPVLTLAGAEGGAVSLPQMTVPSLKNWFGSLPPEQKSDPTLRSEYDRAVRLLVQRATLRKRAGSMQTARKLLAVWHMIHIPLGLSLFLLAFVHIGAAIYYSTLLK